MNKLFQNIMLFIAIFFVLYLLFRNFNYDLKEGMTDASGNTVTPPTKNGIGGNASTYASTIKSANIKLQDTLLVSKYRSDYEQVILNMDDFVNNLMLQTVLNINPSNPQNAVQQLAQLNLAKGALNNVMTFVDKQ
jgi:hypothetical protein